MRYQTRQQFAKIAELLDGGDWACSYGQCGTLIHVCEELAELVKEDRALAKQAGDVAREACSDLDAATRHWADLSHALRHAPMRRDEAIAGGSMH